MELQSTLERYALQLKNTPRTLLSVAGVVQQIMKVLYDTHFPNSVFRCAGACARALGPDDSDEQ